MFLDIISCDLFNGIKTGMFLLGSAIVLRETGLALLELLEDDDNDESNTGA